jgi:hypothetical protein
MQGDSQAGLPSHICPKRLYLIKARDDISGRNSERHDLTIIPS